MTSERGRHYLAIPGPSVVPDAVLRAMHRPSPNIYEGELVEITHSIFPDLRALARTRFHATIYIGNGHAAWEAALANTLAPGDRVLVIATGRFAKGWGEVAECLGAEVEILDFGQSAPVDLERVEERLRADGAKGFKAVLTTQVDTSSGVRTDIAGLRAAMDAAGHPALLMVDCIASMGCEVFEMDDWGVDVAVTGSQKGLMLPAGLGFVFFNDRAAEAREALERVGKYWDWKPRVDPEIYYHYFGGTPPTHLLYGLRAALDMIADEGVEQVWQRHALLARAIWAACERWGEGGAMRLNVADPQHRSHAVTALGLGAPHGSALREWVEKNAGVTLGIGLGMAERADPAWHGYFRIGHMGHVNAQMVMGMLGAIGAGLHALNIDHGAGALEAAAGVLAESG